MLKIGISGVLGKMGQVLKNEVLKDQSLTYIGGFDRNDAENVVSCIDALKTVDVMIDFSTPSALKVLLEYAHKNKVALVLATTGYTSEDFDLIKKYSESIPIFYSSNYSVGIHLLTKALKLVSQSIDGSYDIEIIDKHHRFKKDAPSGTAFKLFDAVNDGLDSKRSLVEGASLDQNIHVHSLRLGNYVGEHQVIFSNLSETIEFSHIAHDKSVFAIGAIKAAKFIMNKEKGLFGMNDLLGEQ